MTIIRHFGAVVASAKQYRRRESAGAAPAFQSAPVILGTPQVGTPVSFLSGSITGSPTPTVTQQWLIDGANITGATNLTYTPQAADLGKTLSVRQTAVNSNGTANSTSAGAVVSGTDFQVNLPTSDYFDTTPIFIDPIIQGFGLMVKGTSTPIAVSTVDGWPTSDFEVVSQILPSPTASVAWTVEFEVGVGTVAYNIRSAQSGDTLSVGAWNSTTKKQVVTYNMTSGRPRATCCIQLTGARRIDGVTGGVTSIRSARPGYTIADLSTKTFTDQFLTSIEKVKVLRFMNWNPANGSQVLVQGTDFSKRPTPANRRTTWSYAEDPTGATPKKLGHAWETCISLVNTANKDAWNCLPINATDAYVTSLAQLWHSSTTRGRSFWEITNEPWNFSGGFEQFDVLLNKVTVELNGYADTTARTGPNTRFISAATRTAGVITLTFSVNHTYTVGGSVRLANIDGVANTTAFTITAVPAANQISFARAGADGSVTINGGSYLYDAATTSNLVAGSGTSQNLFDARFIWLIRRTKEIGELIRAVVGDSNMRTRYVPVYCWQSAGTEFERELRWLKQTFPAQDPGYYVMACGHAPYHSLDGTPMGDLNLAGSTDPTLVVADYVRVGGKTAKVAKRDYDYVEKAATCIHYSTTSNPIDLVCYEAGWDTSTLGGNLPNGAANNAKKSAAQIDATLQPAMEDFYTDIMRYGTNNSIPSQYWHGEGDPTSTLQVDRWWTTDDIGNITRPKIAAMNQVAITARPVQPRMRGVGTFDMRLRARFFEDIDPNLLVTGTFPWPISADIAFNTQSLTYTWDEDSGTPRGLFFRMIYVCNFNSPWTVHIDINGVRVATTAVLSASPADLTTEKTLGPFGFTSRPGRNSIRIVRAGGGSGRDGQLRRFSVLTS